MRAEAYRLLAKRQKTYWWHRARRALALSLLEKNGLFQGCRWIDLGCGPGGNLHLIDSLHPQEVVGIDVSSDALAIAATEAHRARLVQADLNDRLPFSNDYFDVATIFNVLYHDWIRSEQSVVLETARVLKPGGLLLLTEPAFSWLRREMDEAVMTRRRYTIPDLEALLYPAGFSLVYASYFTSFGVPLILGAKQLRKLRHSREDAAAMDMRQIPAALNEALYTLATIELWFIERGIRMPFGTTAICVARRNPR